MQKRKINRLVTSLLSLTLVGASLSPTYALRYNSFDNVNINLPSAIAIDERNGDVLYAQNENEVRPIASLTKSMTFLLILEALERGEIKETDVITLDKTPDSWGSSFYLKEGDTYTIGDFMQMIMIISANDACVVMAEHLSGDVDAFVSLMNKRAKELGMNNTKFYNPNGLPLSRGNNADPGNTSTAKDLSVLVKYIMNMYSETASKYVKAKQLTIKDLETVRYNSNKLLMRQNTFSGYSVDGFKTGYTDEAGFCLITTSLHDNKTPDIKEDDYRVIGVSLGSKNSEVRFNEHTKLLNYVNDTYSNEKILSGNSEVGILNEYNDDRFKATVIPSKDIYVLTNNVDALDFEKTISFSNDIRYPIKTGDTLGVLELKSKVDPSLEFKVELVSANSTKEVNFFDRIFKKIK